MWKLQTSHLQARGMYRINKLASRISISKKTHLPTTLSKIMNYSNTAYPPRVFHNPPNGGTMDVATFFELRGPTAPHSGKGDS